MINKIISEAKAIGRGLPMAMLTFAVVVFAFKGLGWAIEQVAPGQGEALKGKVRI